ncbi:hypothetical protein SCHPADRAFT_183058 [Schizopora paradoxa]|uniref:Cytochrome b561 domain-containing protein n=1 Tax=Schizopora paradoxa TaxID=27342 RepID=A0A0H2SJ75_9AGAM|nr:hypothetical protein SCHPADRAFT_183058 [Schizopora paradoxa]
MESANRRSFGDVDLGSAAALETPIPARDLPSSAELDAALEVKPEGRKGDGAALVVTLVFLIGTWLVIFTNDPSSLGLFAGHPPLQTLAITCFAVGIMTLQPTSQPRTKVLGLVRHQVIMLGLGFPAILTGTILIWANKTIHESAHFTTWHATFGMIAVAWLVIQILLGGFSVWAGGKVFGGGAKAKSVWKYHRLSGYLLFPLLLLTAAIGGGSSTWTSTHVSKGVRVLLYGIAPIVIFLGVWSRMRTSKMNFA